MEEFQLTAISSLFLIFPILLFFYNKRDNFYERVLVFLLVINLILSFLFLSNPIRGSSIHCYDGLFAKLSFVLVSVYILCIKVIQPLMKILFGVVLAFATLMFYHSSQCSSKEWCSPEHIQCHVIFHILISVGGLFAFI